MTLNNLFSVLLVILLTWCALAVYLYIRQPALLYYPDVPTRAIEITPAAIGLEFEDITFITEDNVALHGWYIPSSSARATLLFCHGNAGNISHRLESIQLFNELGLNVLIFDYRGYGKSDGSPSEKGTYQDAQAAWQFLISEKQQAPNEIIVFGRSLGAAIATDLAGRTQPAAVILESAFTSVPDIGADFYPWLPVRLLSRFAYDNGAKIVTIASPILIIHSRDDEIIPFTHSKQLFDLANEPKQFLELSGGHNGGFLENRAIYQKTLDGFLGDHL